MHVSSLDNMTVCVRKHILADPVLAARSPLRVLEVGSADVSKGSYRTAFDRLHTEYVGVDLEDGPGVDLVLDGPGSLPFPDASFDVVVCGQTFEHDPQFWRTFAEMARVVRGDGVVFVLVPSAGPVHRYPVDCYRFYPDAMQGLDGVGGMALVESWVSEFGPWHDHVGVFRPQGFDPALLDVRLDTSKPLLAPPQNEHPPGLPESIEHGTGAMDKYEFMTRVHHLLAPRFYLEIGVEYGNSLALAQCDAVGIDPAPQLQHPVAPHHRVSVMTSDDFFLHSDETAGLPTVDLAYLDGMHLAEYLLKDFMYVERRCGPCSVVIIDDIFPAHPLQAERTRQSRFWTGDVWKMIPVLRGARPDLLLLPVDTYPTGTLLVLGLDPDNRALWERYDVFADWMITLMTSVHEGIVEREGALRPEDPLIERVLGMVRHVREEHDPTPTLERVRHLVAGSFPRKVSLG